MPAQKGVLLYKEIKNYKDISVSVDCQVKLTTSKITILFIIGVIMKMHRMYIWSRMEPCFYYIVGQTLKRWQTEHLDIRIKLMGIMKWL